MKDKILAIRFEGTISTASPHDTAFRADYGEPRDEVISAIHDLDSRYRLVIVATASASWHGRTMLIAWLNENHVPFDEVWDGPGLPSFDYMLDDASHDVSDKSLRVLLGTFGTGEEQ